MKLEEVTYLNFDSVLMKEDFCVRTLIPLEFVGDRRRDVKHSPQSRRGRSFFICLFSGLPDGNINPVSPVLGQDLGWTSQNVGRRSQAGVGWQRRRRVVASASEVKSCSVVSDSL